MRANLPTNYAHNRRAGDAGLDLRAAGDTPHHIPAGAIRIIPTEITGEMLNLDPQHVALVCPRSGLAARGITVANSPGIIDAGYTITDIDILTPEEAEALGLALLAAAQHARGRHE